MKFLEIEFPILLGILPGNIERISRDLFSFMLRATSVTFAMRCQSESCPAIEIWKEKLADNNSIITRLRILQNVNIFNIRDCYTKVGEILKYRFHLIASSNY